MSELWRGLEGSLAELKKAIQKAKKPDVTRRHVSHGVPSVKVYRVVSRKDEAPNEQV